MTPLHAMAEGRTCAWASDWLRALHFVRHVYLFVPVNQDLPSPLTIEEGGNPKVARRRRRCIRYESPTVWEVAAFSVCVYSTESFQKHHAFHPGRIRGTDLVSITDDK